MALSDGLDLQVDMEGGEYKRRKRRQGTVEAV